MFLPYLCMLVTLCGVGVAVPTTSNYVYNSSDLSYFSNGIQFPAPEHDFNVTIPGEPDEKQVPKMKWLSDLYDHYKWDAYVRTMNDSGCKRDLEVYVRELYGGALWATKIYDAAGRYMGQFLFGHDYWLGSSTLCHELANPETNENIPPFPVKFMMTKIRINVDRELTPVTRQINIGECIPASCTKNDLRWLFSQEKKQGASINIVDVREVPGSYLLRNDPKFRLVGSVAFAVFSLVIIASIVELAIKSKSKKMPNMDMENNNNNNNKMTKEPKVKNNFEKNIAVKLLLCFSAVRNGKKILSVENATKTSISCIHGLRFFSILWIILVHTYLEIFGIAGNKNLRVLTERTFIYQTISNASFSVDTFFFISGLLITITYFRTETKKQGPENELTNTLKTGSSKFGLMLVYRYLRLTPAYLFVLGVNEVVMRYLHDRSVFSPAIIDHVTCDAYWWRNILYINNFFPQAEFCMLWSWYMANDTQFYVIASVLLILATRSKRHLKIAGIIILVTIVLSWIVTFVIAIEYNYVARVEEPFRLFDQLYDKPWMRIGPYLIGMLLGYYFFATDLKIKIKYSAAAIGWVTSVLTLAILVYGLGREGLVVPASAFYAALGHTAWGCALAWITTACVSGFGGPLNSLLSCQLLVPLSRLTFCAYLIHPVLMCFTSFLLDGPLHLHNVFAMVIFCGNAVISFIAAFIISLTFEAPVVNLLKIIL